MTPLSWQATLCGGGGGSTWALECGVHPLFIRIQGDWKSDTWLLYVGLFHEQKRSITRTMQEGIQGV